MLALSRYSFGGCRYCSAGSLLAMNASLASGLKVTRRVRWSTRPPRAAIRSRSGSHSTWQFTPHLLDDAQGIAMDGRFLDRRKHLERVS